MIEEVRKIMSKATANNTNLVSDRKYTAVKEAVLLG